MGIRGLTSYIYSKDHLYFDTVTLKDCALVIDGNGLSVFLYNRNLIHCSAFGGDYDKLGAVYETFFKHLINNNVFPIVVFDGGCERRKVNTIIIRAKNKVISLQNVTPSTANASCSPLMMRKVMNEKLLEMGICLIQADLEADDEIAALAKALGVPVLAEDSDFFIFDVQYIPMTKADFGNRANSEIECKLFIMEKFLRHVDLDRDRLPLLAVLLGNDYIRRSEVGAFLGQIKLGKSKRGTYTQKVIAGVLQWLKSETIESALQKILSSMPMKAREALRRKIRKVMNGYSHFSSDLINYVDTTKVKPIHIPSENSYGMSKLVIEMNGTESDFDSGDEDTGDSPYIVAVVAKKSSSSDADGYCSSGSDTKDGEEVVVADIKSFLKEPEKVHITELELPGWLKERSRRGLVRPTVLSLLNIRAFFSTPQVECYEMSWSGEPYLRILQCVAGLVLGPTDIQCWYRQHRNNYERTTISSVCETPNFGTFPSLKNLGALSSEERRAIFNDVMEVDENTLAHVPDEWKLYFVSIQYWLKKDSNYEIKAYHLHSVILMMITLLVVDGKIGFHRVRKTFSKTYGGAVHKISRQRESMKNVSYPVCQNISSALQLVTKEDCIFIFNELLPFLQLDRQTQYSKHFSRNLIHSFARLQSCLEFTSLLNDILSAPYPDLKIHKFYNGIFLYNMAGNLKKRTNVLNYVDLFLAKVPTLLGLYHAIFEMFENLSPLSSQKKPRKKKKTKPDAEVLVPKLTFDSDSEQFFDKNNRFCVMFA